MCGFSFAKLDGSIRPVRLFFIFSLIFLFSLQARSQSSQQIFFDRHQSEFLGAGNLLTLHKALYTFQDKYIPDTLFHEHNFWTRASGFVCRMARLWLFDAQIDYMIMLSQHEIFGHGSRFREMAYSNNAYHLSLFFPYGNGHGYAKTGVLAPGNTVTSPEYIAVSFAGNEANLLLAGRISGQVLLDHSMHYRQAFLYLISQNNQLAYIWYSRLSKKYSAGSGNDISGYLLWTNSMYRGRGKAYSTVSLSEQSLLSLANPMQFYAAYSLLIRYGVQGKKKMENIPMIPLGPVRYLPAFNYSLTPFGSQFHWINYFSYRSMLFAAEFRYGDPRFRHSYDLRLEGYNFLNIRWLGMNAALEMWKQPDMNLENYSPYLLNNRYGGLISADFNIRPLRLPYQLGLYLQAGYKTKGYAPGETLDRSLLLRYGISACF